MRSGLSLKIDVGKLREVQPITITILFDKAIRGAKQSL